jgi:hypothetical protein
MSSNAAPHPGDQPSVAVPSPARTATIDVDDLGITIRADLRITGVVAEVRDLFASTPGAEQPALLEKVIVIGATAAAATAGISAADAARVKLTQSADALMAAHERLLERHETQSKQLKDQIDDSLRALRLQLSDSGKQEELLRRQLKEGQAEVVKVAKQLDVSREDLEKRTTAAIATLVAAQTTAKTEVVKGTETALKKLMDGREPTSAATKPRQLPLRWPLLQRCPVRPA